jgi:hypothetical protein
VPVLLDRARCLLQLQGPGARARMSTGVADTQGLCVLPSWRH